MPSVYGHDNDIEVGDIILEWLMKDELNFVRWPDYAPAIETWQVCEIFAFFENPTYEGYERLIDGMKYDRGREINFFPPSRMAAVYSNGVLFEGPLGHPFLPNRD